MIKKAIRKKIILLVSAYVLSVSCAVFAQPFASWTNRELRLNNGVVERIIQLPLGTGSFTTTLYKPVQGDFKYFASISTDFQFEADHIVYSGKGNWILKSITRHTDSNSGDGAMVTLLSEDNKIELAVQYLLYPGMPVIRKNLVVKNLSQKAIPIESVDVEKFDVPFYDQSTHFDAPAYSWIYHDYGRRRSIGPYDGNMQDALLIVHNSDWQQGIVIGNEAPGAIKHTSVFWNELSICAGVTHKDARFPFRKYLNKGELFTTPQVFTIVYNHHKDPDEILNTAVPEFVRRYMGIRLSVLKQKPTFVYNTWVPFTDNINEKLIMELAKSAAAAGMKEFVIDDGWQQNYGDWVIDKKKFPNGLKPVFDYIKSLGMKPGLWISVGSASPSSKVYKEHPDWFVLDENQKPFNLHIDDTTIRTACFGTGWYSYIKNILTQLAVDYGLEYMKLDFTVVTSPYRFNNHESGCYATNHQGHIDHNESLYTNYEQVWKLFDELHAAKPDLFIDCTFETMGALQLIDYAMLKHAEGNWLSNFRGHDPTIDLRLRNMAWWRSPAIAATALVIGNSQMQDINWDLHVKSLAGALPILLGDPRKLSVSELKKFRSLADWLQSMESRYRIMSYRQDLPGFGEPVEGRWDGFQRINTEKRSGGIIGIFRNGGVETKRIVTVHGLDPAKTYYVKQINGKIRAIMTGEELVNKGFLVAFNKPYDGELFEISTTR